MQHFLSIHEQVIALRINNELVPVVPKESRMSIKICDKGFVQIQLNCGFMEKISIPDTVSSHWPDELRRHTKPVSYFLNRLIFVPQHSNDISTWRKTLFRFLYRNGQQPLMFFSLPVADTMLVSIPTTI
jgi:KUP system potassium uptake protein